MNTSLHSVMNNTKWDELRLAMYNLTQRVQFRVKSLGSDYVSDWDGEWFYNFREGGYDDIEWVELTFELEDRRAVIAEIAYISVPCLETDKGVTVFGYIDDTGRLAVPK